MLLTLGILAAADALWILLYRDNHALNAHIARENACSGRVVNAFSGMRQAVSRRDVWLVCRFMGLGSIASNGINTYRPQFLQTVRGYSDTAASAVVGVTAGVSGRWAPSWGARSPPSWAGARACCAPCLAVSRSLVWPFLWCAPGRRRFPASSSPTPCSPISAPPPLRPSPPSCPTAPLPWPPRRQPCPTGVGFVGTFACAPLLKLSTALFGVEYSLLIYLPLFALSLLFCDIWCRENRPRPEKARFDAKLAASLQVNIL